MAKRKRDYAAEYQRRQALAKSRGFASYGKQRRAIERGKIRAIAPTRVRKRSTIEAQEKLGGLFGAALDVTKYRIDAAEAWQQHYSHARSTSLDRTRYGERGYLDTYNAAFLLNTKDRAKGFHSLSGTPEQHRWFVEYGGMTEEEWQERYGKE